MNLESRAKKIYVETFDQNVEKTNKLFTMLMFLQWGTLVMLAVLNAPFEWDGDQSSFHPHLISAIFIGGSVTGIVYYVAKNFSSDVFTRHTVAAAQMLMSILVIHLTGGRLESHFHIFGSLAFLAFYKDPKVLITASIVIALDHMIGGVYWPDAIYGSSDAESWRWLEHTSWVLFEDVFLVYSCMIGNEHMQELSLKQAKLEFVNAEIEEQVQQRTSELKDSLQLIELQKMVAIESSKMAALGEMAAGMAHEINNPLAAIRLSSEQLQDLCSDEKLDSAYIKDLAGDIAGLTTRISSIIKSLKSYARDGTNDPFIPFHVREIVHDTVIMCEETFKSRKVELKVDCISSDLMILCRPVQISQVLVNLIQNALDAVEHLPEKWVQVKIERRNGMLRIAVIDSGKGINEEIREKILRPFFTTKEVGKGTGLGLSVSKGIMEAHHGELRLEKGTANTQFSLILKEYVNAAKSA